MITGIVVALPEELRTLISGKIEKGRYAFLTEKILVAYAGAGPENAGKATRMLIANGVGQLVSWGCAAALAPDMAPGELVIADRVVSTDRQSLACNDRWSAHARHVLKKRVTIKTGSLVSSEDIVSSSQDKQTLYTQSAALGVDMESYAIVEQASLSSLPCLVLRAVADPAGMSLPKAISHSFNAAGEIERGKLLRFILCHPLEIPALIRLGLFFAAAERTLTLTSKYLDKIMDFCVNETED